MFAVHSPRRSPAIIVGTVIVAVLLGCSAFPFNYSSKAFNLPGQSAEGVQFELPANGNLRVENPRGSVFVEVWNQTYLSVAAVSDSGESIPSPAVIHSTASLVSVRVPAGAARASQVNLRLRIPARTHAAILTTNGAVEVKAID